MSNKRRGPEPTPIDQLRNNRISANLTIAEYEAVRVKAGNVSLPIYARSALLQAKPTPPPPVIPTANLEVWKSSAGLQNNLNQLVRTLNSRGIEADALEELAALVALLRAALVGVQQ
ncbi:TPA: hypothetical protein ACLEYZ_005799 [Pseudomonas aeruginosa]